MPVPVPPRFTPSPAQLSSLSVQKHHSIGSSFSHHTPTPQGHLQAGSIIIPLVLDIPCSTFATSAPVVQWHAHSPDTGQIRIGPLQEKQQRLNTILHRSNQKSVPWDILPSKCVYDCNLIQYLFQQTFSRRLQFISSGV